MLLEEIEHQLNMKPEEDRIAQRKQKYPNDIHNSSVKKKVPKKKKKQHVIDEDSSLNQSTVMTQGWGVTKEVPAARASIHGDSFVQGESNFSSTKSRKIKRVTDRLYGGHVGHHHRHEHLTQRAPIAPNQNSRNSQVQKRAQTKEWIGNKNNLSMGGSQGSSEDGVWVSNY